MGPASRATIEEEERTSLPLLPTPSFARVSTNLTQPSTETALRASTSSSAHRLKAFGRGHVSAVSAQAPLTLRSPMGNAPKDGRLDPWFSWEKVWMLLGRRKRWHHPHQSAGSRWLRSLFLRGWLLLFLTFFFFLLFFPKTRPVGKGAGYANAPRAALPAITPAMSSGQWDAGSGVEDAGS